jgi:ubiquinone/menaquinone biosynthesis C-methylase UbiE
MEHMTAQEQAVGRHYDENILAFETERLPQHSPVEYAITLRFLERFIGPAATVAEVGVGGGYYSAFLARRGCTLYLIDVSERLLEVAAQRLGSAGLASCLRGLWHGSATALTPVPDASCDAVQLLGPLYHLCSLADRRRAVAEAARVLKPGGVVYAAGVNRLAFFRDAFRTRPEYTPERKAFHLQFLQDGNLDPEHAPPLGYAHLSTSSEFRALFAGSFHELVFAGVESFMGIWQDLLATASADSAAAWLDLVEQTGQTADGVGASDHFLYVGRKPEEDR